MAEKREILLHLTRIICALFCFHVATLRNLATGYRSGDVRLSGGNDKYEGSVLVYSRGHWKTVCGLEWNIYDATVLCRQLGFRGLRRHLRHSKFGEGSIYKLKVEFRCRGNENTLLKCPRRIRRNPLMKLSCGARHVSAGVVCKKPRVVRTTTKATTTTPIPTTTPPRITVWTTKSSTIDSYKSRFNSNKNVTTILHALAANRSEPEIRLKEENNLKDDRNVLKDERKHIAGNTGSSTSENSEFTKKKKGGEEEEKDEKSEENTKENTSENSEKEVTEETEETKVDLLKKIAKNKVTEEKPDDIKESAVDQSKDHQEKEKFKVTLDGGRFKKEGRVAILLPGAKKYGVICGDHWSYFEASVVCRQLGFGLVKQIFQVNYYGGSELDKLFARIRCHGNESHLADCQTFEYYNQVKCSTKESVASLICTDELPDLVPDAEALRLSMRLEDKPLYYLQCAMEENCLASEAYEVKEHSRDWVAATRRLLRFSSIVHNRGIADFIPNTPKDSWEWHECHMHYHSMEVFAHYDIMDLKGNRVAQGHKASFCLEDTRCPSGITPKYNCIGYGDQGLSVNCSDNYYHDIDCQWIDITDMKFGSYILKVEFNPNMHVSEMTFDNNVVQCQLYYSGTYAQAYNCEIIPLLRRD
ncbi:lysyl oxidase homolog 4 [Octopus bimaculoides]|nr:lysyl oxidase homolog 4 [Octopus bimaculoides]|eukprot:XP_014775645.1 PREDICTED: lysyl oxidase homolog 4-like [Octopus bimaculoides]